MEIRSEGGDELVVGLLGEGEGLGAVGVGFEGGDRVGDDGDGCEVLRIVSWGLHARRADRCESTELGRGTVDLRRGMRRMAYRRSLEETSWWRWLVECMAWTGGQM